MPRKRRGGKSIGRRRKYHCKNKKPQEKNAYASMASTGNMSEVSSFNNSSVVTQEGEQTINQPEPVTVTTNLYLNTTLSPSGLQPPVKYDDLLPGSSHVDIPTLSTLSLTNGQSKTGCHPKKRPRKNWRLDGPIRQTRSKAQDLVVKVVSPVKKTLVILVEPLLESVLESSIQGGVRTRKPRRKIWDPNAHHSMTRRSMTEDPVKVDTHNVTVKDPLPSTIDIFVPLVQVGKCANMDNLLISQESVQNDCVHLVQDGNPIEIDST